ncbi:hypothetical protein MKW98_028866 [Papaver atlanticum]|uniref:Uncharacterized protein n=1 Tax=Papaver atlanticum TaxID=357466 RepID=A0AAD4X6R2_9MAGN|nr:hypothetical protein MKW98_028866 [Papaver atlanticum]
MGLIKRICSRDGVLLRFVVCNCLQVAVMQKLSAKGLSELAGQTQCCNFNMLSLPAPSSELDREKINMEVVVFPDLLKYETIFKDGAKIQSGWCLRWLRGEEQLTQLARELFSRWQRL